MVQNVMEKMKTMYGERKYYYQTSGDNAYNVWFTPKGKTNARGSNQGDTSGMLEMLGGIADKVLGPQPAAKEQTKPEEEGILTKILNALPKTFIYNDNSYFSNFEMFTKKEVIIVPPTQKANTKESNKTEEEKKREAEEKKKHDEKIMRIFLAISSLVLGAIVAYSLGMEVGALSDTKEEMDLLSDRINKWNENDRDDYKEASGYYEATEKAAVCGRRILLRQHSGQWMRTITKSFLLAAAILGFGGAVFDVKPLIIGAFFVGGLTLIVIAFRAALDYRDSIRNSEDAKEIRKQEAIIHQIGENCPSFVPAPAMNPHYKGN